MVDRWASETAWGVVILMDESQFGAVVVVRGWLLEMWVEGEVEALDVPIYSRLECGISFYANRASRAVALYHGFSIESSELSF